MAISYPDFPMLNFQQANPLLSGVHSGQKIAHDYLKNSILGQEAPYANDLIGYERDIKRQQAQASPITSILGAMNPVSALYFLAHPDQLGQILQNAGTASANLGATGPTAGPRPNSYSSAPAGAPNQYLDPNQIMDQSGAANPSDKRSFRDRLQDVYNVFMGKGNHGNISQPSRPRSAIQSRIERNGMPTDKHFQETADQYGRTIEQVKKDLGY